MAQRTTTNFKATNDNDGEQAPAPRPSRFSLAQLYNMETRPKSDPSFEALGNMDELNACLALAVEHSEAAGNGLSEMLLTIQSLIIDASALVATPRDNSSARKINRTEFPTWCTEQLEVGGEGSCVPHPELLGPTVVSGRLDGGMGGGERERRVV